MYVISESTGIRRSSSFLGEMHNVKSDLIWRKYSPWWLNRAIAWNWETYRGLEIRQVSPRDLPIEALQMGGIP